MASIERAGYLSDAVGGSIALADIRLTQGRLRDGVDSHHNVARFGWELVPPEGGESVVEGFDVAMIEDGRIGSVVGFLDKAPSES